MQSRRRFVSLSSGVCVAALLPLASVAQTFPSKPIRFIVPFSPGGAADVLARLIGEHMSQQLGQPVIIELKPGGGTVIGSAYVAKAPADGHTILFIANSFVINAKLRSDLPYDGMRAFQPVANMVSSPQVIAVNASSLYQTFNDWLVDARARPGAVSIGTLGPATAQHVAAEMLQRATGTKLIYVPFPGGTPAIVATLSGHVDMVLANLSELAPHIEAGKLRPLAVTAPERLDALSHVPTVAELGYPGYEAVAWFGVAAPAGTRADVVTKIAGAIRTALADPALRQRIVGIHLQPAFMDPKAFGAYIADQYTKYARVLDEAKIKTE